MFKKAKLHIFLSIIVASTVASVVGFSSTVLAADATWVEGRTNEAIVYGSEVCTEYTPLDNVYANIDEETAFGFDDKLAFTCTIDSNTSKMILFRNEQISGTAFYTTFTKIAGYPDVFQYKWTGERQISFDPNGTSGPDTSPDTAPPNLPPVTTASWSGTFAPGESSSSLSYADMNFVSMDMSRTELLTAAGIPSDAAKVYAAPQTSDTLPNKFDHFIYFPAGTDWANATSATYVILRTDPDDNRVKNQQAITVDASTAKTEKDSDTDGGGEAEPSNCQIEGIGWLVCPIITFTAKIIDRSYDILESSLLQVEPLALPGSADNADTKAKMQLYNSWKIMRDFANVLFIIAFLFIVFSQLTSVGISNYGIKRLLPKIVIAAILVNVSFYICAVGVDLSNILGNSLKGMFDGIAGAIDTAPPPDGTADPNPDNLKEFKADGTVVYGWVGLAEFILAAAAVYVMLPMFLPLLIGAALAIMTVVIALTLRQALIILLIVVSPLAFVALLLPNTEDYFKKWKSLFTSMLMVYPIISIIFGASALASTIIMKSSDETMVQIIGAGVAIIPLFITPIIMKVSGGLLNRWVGLVNNPNRGPIDGMKKGAAGLGERWEGRRKIESLNGGGTRFGGLRYRRAAKKHAINEGIKAEVGRETSQYIAGEVQKGTDSRFGLANSIAGGMVTNKADQGAIDRSLARAQFTVESAELEEVKAAGVTVENMNLSELTKVMNDDNSSHARKAAALDRMVAISDPPDYEEYVNRYGSDTSQDSAIIRRTLSESLAKNGPSFLKAPDLDNIKNGQLGGKSILDKSGRDTGDTTARDLASIARTNTAAGVVSQAKMVADSNGNLKYAFNSADPAGKLKMSQTANELKSNPTLSGQIKHNEQQINRIASHAPPTPTTTTTTATPATTTTAGTIATPAATPPATGTMPTTPATPAPPPGWTVHPSGVVTPPPRKGSGGGSGPTSGSSGGTPGGGAAPPSGSSGGGAAPPSGGSGGGAAASPAISGGSAGAHSAPASALSGTLTPGEAVDIAHGKSVTTSTGSVVEGSNLTTQLEAIQKVVDRGNPDEIDSVYDVLRTHSGPFAKEARSGFVEILDRSSSAPKWYTADAKQALRDSDSSPISTRPSNDLRKGVR